MAEMSAKGAVGILMEADTGQIRAHGEPARLRPEPAPAAADRGDPADSPLFNRAAQGRYELGSTFKIFAVAAGARAGRRDARRR